MAEPKAVPKFWKTWTLAKAAVRWSRPRDARLSVKIAMARQLANSAKITNATWPKIHKIHQKLNQNASTCIKICGINSCLCAPILELRCPCQIPQCLSVLKSKQQRSRRLVICIDLCHQGTCMMVSIHSRPLRIASTPITTVGQPRPKATQASRVRLAGLQSTTQPIGNATWTCSDSKDVGGSAVNKAFADGTTWQFPNFQKRLSFDLSLTTRIWLISSWNLFVPLA